MTNSLGTCDYCGEGISGHGWIVPTGEALQLETDGPAHPVYWFYCTETCARDDLHQRQLDHDQQEANRP